MTAQKKRSAKLRHRPQATHQLPTALVAGAAGFIGSHLCDALLHQNCRIYAVDNWTTGKKENIKHLLDQKNFVFLEHDLDKPFTSSLPVVDYIFHLAGVEAYLNGLDVSLETLLVNSLGTRELLELAKKNQAKFLLASTVDIFSGFLAATDLAHYFGQKKAQAEAYSHHEAKRFSEALTFEYVDRYQLNARVVRLSTVYGPRMDLNSGNYLSRLFLNLKKNQSLKVIGQGLAPVYPTYISDIVYGLTKAMFCQSSQAKIYTLINPEKSTLLSLAYELKEALPEKKLNIEFVSGDEPDVNFSLPPEVFDSQTELGWSPKISFKQGIEPTLKWLTEGQIKTVSEPEPEPEPELKTEAEYSPEALGLQPAPAAPAPVKPKRRLALPKLPKLPRLPKRLKLPKLAGSPKFKLGLIAAVLLLLYLLVPVLLLFVFATRGTRALQKAGSLTDFGQITKLTQLTTRAQKDFNFSRQLLRRSQPLASIFGAKKLSYNLDQLLFIGAKLSQGAIHLAKAGEAGTVLSQIIFHHEEGSISQAIKDVRLNLDQAYSELSFVESELQSGRELQLDISSSINQRFQALTRALPQIRQKINQARLIAPIVPGFVAQDSKKTYLVLFQNSTEIRPTGGFIGSYGLLTFEKGKLLDFVVEDIYSADGQLKGYVEPPQPIAKFLGQNTWYFRDSNWDPDFIVSSQRAEWFLGKTINRKVDGVIAINLPAVKELLKATGSITLTDYNEEVNSDNLFERSEYHAEIDFFPGSTQKKDFLGSLAREIFTRMQNSSSADLLKFAQALETSLAEKQVLIYLHDQDSQRLLVDQNWAGTIYPPSRYQDGQLTATSDYSYLIEANLGINKANYFLKRNIQQQLTILKNKEILAVTTIDYQNQSPADTWPGGVYHSYVRQYLPLGSTVISVKADERKLGSNEVDQSVVKENLVLGFPVTVPVKSAIKVEITYRLPKVLQLTNRQGQLVIVVPKQPGIVDDPLSVIVNYPSFLSVSRLAPNGLVSPQVVTFASDLRLDRVFTIDFIER